MLGILLIFLLFYAMKLTFVINYECEDACIDSIARFHGLYTLEFWFIKFKFMD